VRRLQLKAAAVFALAWASACAGESGTLGLNEPLQVTGGAFKTGALPGAPPDPQADTDAALRITTIETNNTIVHPGQSGKRISGRAKDLGYAIALRFEKQGTGYWVRPLEETDSAYPGELSFRVDLELARDLPLGPQRLLFTVIDRKGNASRQQLMTLCVTSPYDRSLHACDATQRPPAAAISLRWDTAADLDLIVHTPDGEVVDARHPSTQTDPSLADSDPAYQGHLLSDDSRGCSASSARREDLVWYNEVPSGRYRVFVNLFDACDARATFFEVSASLRSELEDGSYTFDELAPPVLGQVIEDAANGGKNYGRAIVNIEFP